MSPYAADTSVSIEKSKGEIEATLRRYGASRFAYGWEPDGATVFFEARSRRIRFYLPLPDPDDEAFTFQKVNQTHRKRRTAEAAEKAWDQACRSRWRALHLVIKAKLEAVESGIVSFEAEFLAHTMLPSGETVGDWAEPALNVMYETGQLPPLLPGGPSTPQPLALGSGRG